MLDTEPVLILIEDMYIFYNSSDHALEYALTDPRAKRVDISTAAQKWSAHTAVPDEAWTLKGMGIFSLAAIHFWRENLDFAYYDVGANIGMTAIAQAIFFRRCSHDNRTIAFEPGPVGIQLQKSIHLNGLSSAIDLRRMAVSDKPGEVTFHVTPKQSPASSLLQAAVDRPGVEATIAVTVHAVRLDDVIEAQTAPHALIKIDAEGADFKVLAGLSGALKNRHCVILIEFFPMLVETYADPVVELFALSQAFEIFEVDDARLTPVASNVQAFAELIIRTKARAMLATDLMFLPKKLPNLARLRSRLLAN